MRGAGAAYLLALALAGPVTLAQASPEDELTPPREPPLTLPEGATAIIQRSRRAEEGAGQVDSIRGVFRALRACWRVPPEPGGPTGQQATIRLSFKRNGEVLGRPRITYTQLAPEREVQERFLASVLSSLDRCVPLSFSEGFGQAVAGRPFTLRFVDDRPT